MSAINNSTFNFNTEELKEWAEVIHELTWTNPDIAEVHEVHEGVAYNKQIVFAGNIGLMGKAVTGCTPNEIEGIAITDKTWTPVKEDFRLTHCSVDVDDQDKLINRMARINPDFYNIFEGSQSSLGQFLVAKVLQGIIDNIIRKIWFSDTAASNVADGGLLTNGTDVGYFNTFDGLFKQLMANIGTDSKYYVAIDANAGTSYESQKLSSGQAMEILKTMVRKGDNRLLKDPDAKIYVTKSMWDAYEDDLQDFQNNGGGNTTINEEGKVTLFCKGVPLYKMESWDIYKSSYYDNGTIIDKPHFAVLTTKSNIPVSTLASGDFGTVDAFYDKVTKLNYIEGAYSIDAKHLENYLTVVAY